MRAGDRNRRITIQAVTYEEDGWGQVQVWTDLATVWAEVKQENGREFFAHGGVSSERKVVFRLKWIEGVSVTARVIYDGRQHNIHEVRELGRKEGLELHATASG